MADGAEASDSYRSFSGPIQRSLALSPSGLLRRTFSIALAMTATAARERVRAAGSKIRLGASQVRGRHRINVIHVPCRPP
jgi:hypothetical protein